MILGKIFPARRAAGRGSVSVYRKIRAGVPSTGDEVSNGMVRNCNAPVACAMLQRWGCEAGSGRLLVREIVVEVRDLLAVPDSQV